MDSRLRVFRELGLVAWLRPHDCILCPKCNRYRDARERCKVCGDPPERPVDHG